MSRNMSLAIIIILNSLTEGFLQLPPFARTHDIWAWQLLY